MKPAKHATTAQLDAVEELRKADHAFLNAEGVNKITAPFGFTGWAYLHKANPRDPKGLTFFDGSKEGIGMDAAQLAVRLCNRLGVDYLEAFGRGTQLRNCCDALEKYLTTNQRRKKS